MYHRRTTKCNSSCVAVDESSGYIQVCRTAIPWYARTWYNYRAERSIRCSSAQTPSRDVSGDMTQIARVSFFSSDHWFRIPSCIDSLYSLLTMMRSSRHNRIQLYSLKPTWKARCLQTNRLNSNEMETRQQNIERWWSGDWFCYVCNHVNVIWCK